VRKPVPVSVSVPEKCVGPVPVPVPVSVPERNTE
jgi:hypothetical protein